MKKELILSMILLAGMPNILAQQSQEQPSMAAMPQKGESTFQQVDKVRKALNLDQKQFEKVYKAYDSYNKAIFGDSSQSGMPMGGPRGGMGGPGGGMGGPGGGMGGPGGGMGGPGGGMGGPSGGMGGPDGGSRPQFSGDSESRPTPPKEMSAKDIEKMHKKMQKQEEKLHKSVRKALKDDAIYAQWLEIREAEMMPPKPQQ